MILQKLTTIVRGTDTGTIIQPQQNWLNVGRARRLVLTTELFNLTGDATLSIDTSENPTAEWYSMGILSNATDLGSVVSTVLSRGVPLSQSFQLRQYVRWSFYAGTAGYEMTFRIRYTLN